MRNVILAVSALTLAVPAMPSAALAHGYSSYDDSREYRGRSSYNSSRDYRGRSWRGRDGRYYCQKSNGTTGLLIGGAGGALLGREIDGGRDKTTGTILGAAVGALLGRHVDRNVVSNKRHCR